MAIPRNKLIPILGAVGVAIAGTIIVVHFKGDPAPSTPAPSSAARKPAGILGGTARPADGDNANETLSTVVASNSEMRKQIQAVIDQNRRTRQKCHYPLSRASLVRRSPE